MDIFFGVLWGIGGLTFGLTMRFLGLSLGMGIALGYCGAFGTLVPPIFKEFMPDIPVASSILTIAASVSGQVILGGVAVCLLGIGIAALAGWTKEKEMPEEQKKDAIKEFNFKRGLLVATFSGIMSACYAFALQAGKPINDTSLAAGTDKIWTGLPALVVVLLGGFTTNFIWCALLSIKNQSGCQYIASHVRQEYTHYRGLSSQRAISLFAETNVDLRIPVLSNYLFCALAGTCWYFQFFFYSMGATKMGAYDFASWTLHMASIIIFSTIWGWIFHEWKGASKKSHRLIAAGIITLVLSTVIIGLGVGWTDFIARFKSR